MSTSAFALTLSGLALLLLLITVFAQRRSFGVLGLWRKQWVSGQIGLAESAAPEVAARGILGVVESYAIEGRTWSERAADRIDHEVVFVPIGSTGRSSLELGRTRLFLNARRRYTNAYRNSMQVERMLREGDPITVILDSPLPRSAENSGYRFAAGTKVAPVAIFAGSRSRARWRLLKETMYFLAPVVLIVAMCSWAIGMELALRGAAAESQCIE